MQEKRVQTAFNGLEESYTFGKVARQADGSVLYRQGKAVILATVVREKKRIEENFLPLTVQYIEKAYAAAKIPGGFIKRESKPGDFEVLTSRLVDRSLRPLFPEGYDYPTVITLMVLSSDGNVDLQVAALHAANAALLVSDIPVERSIAALRIGRVDGEYRFHPSLDELDSGSLDLLFVGSGEELLMIEMGVKATEKTEEIDEISGVPGTEAAMGAVPILISRQESNELDEAELVRLVREASDPIREAALAYEKLFLPFKKSRPGSTDSAVSGDGAAEVADLLRERCSDALERMLDGLAKSERSDRMEEIVSEAEIFLKEHGRSFEPSEVLRGLEMLRTEKVRSQILEKGKRADGRRPDEVRPISIETNLLPSVHGSALFSRGETQVLATVTLGEAKEGQMYELLTDRGPRTERFMVHYNFPGFSVGEARPLGAPGRRELGHGILAKRALEPVIDQKSSRTVRLVAEVLESNGSSSMATVCAGALALRAAEIEMTSLVAGVAMGLIREDDRYVILTDIMGLEDHDGDMDFKVAGTRNGITAMQMDVKRGGLDPDLLEKALEQAKKARGHILDLMEEAEERIRPSSALPVSEHFHIDPSKIVHVIGKAGATIRDIIERFEVKIDLDREKGGVKVTGEEREKVLAAKEHISRIASQEENRTVPRYEPGKQYRGTVKRIVDYGIFVEMPGGHDALLHISKIGKERIGDLHARYREGEEIDVVVLEQNGRKVELATPEYLE